jgi:hypothetical protein
MELHYTTQNAPKFLCKKCDFKCFKQSDFKRHLNTIKHSMEQKEPVNTPKHATAYMCRCGKQYKVKSGLWKHSKKCNQMNSLTVAEDKYREPTDNSTILGLISQNKELMDMLQEQNKIIKELVPKVGNNNNNNNNTTNNTQFNLQVFLNEDCKEALNFSEFVETIKVSFTDLENQAENGYVKGISKLFIESLQSLGINQRPIHCTDKKRKTLYIKENDAWDKEGSLDTIKKGIQKVSQRTFAEFIKSTEDFADEYEDGDSEFSQKCISIQRNLVPNHPREITIQKVIENITASSSIDKMEKM